MQRTLIIAEAGVNHDGSVETALELVDVAADADADVVKFQTFETDEVVTDHAPQAGYQRERAPAGSQAEMLRALVLDLEADVRLVERCNERGIEFLSTAFDERSFGRLIDLGIRRVKVGSGELTNGPLLLAFARAGLPLIVSTGMASLGDIEQALAVIAFGMSTAEGHPSRADLAEAYDRCLRDGSLVDRVTLLHCTSSYPAPPEGVHLAALESLGVFGLPVGYSDHTLGTAISFAAVARGACVLEKHFTLDRQRPGPDHAASLEPQGLRELVTGIREIEAAVGSRIKYPAGCELDTMAVARRSLVAARAIHRGDVFDTTNLKALRPGGGRSPMDLWDVLGRNASRDYVEHETIDGAE